VVIDERELVGLLYRADWTRLTLSGTVRGLGQFPATSADNGWWKASFGGGVRPGTFTLPDPPPEPPQWLIATAEPPEGESTLSLAPGRRYRLARTDGSRVLGCDGERVWQWFADVPPEAAVTFERRPQPPIPELLAPAWLLIGGPLTIEGETTVAGRPGIVVTGAAPTAPLPGLNSATMLAWGLLPRAGRISAVIDAELGIVLRRERPHDRRGTTTVEFVRLEVGGAVDPSVFDPADGSFFGDGRPGEAGWARPPLDSVGLGALKMAGGLLASGLGAAVKYAPKRRRDPFATATAEEPDAAMPDDGPLPGWAAGQPANEADGPTPVSDEVLNLLYRGGRGPAPFSGRVCEWTDGEVVGRGLLGAVPESARRAGFGGVGFLVDAMLAAEQWSGEVEHAVYSVRIGALDTYRIDRVYREPPTRSRRGPARRHDGDAVTVACDGRRTFRVFDDEVRVGPASMIGQPQPAGLLQLVDGSWLLRYSLSGGEVVEVDGRRGYRVVATIGNGPTMDSPMSWLAGWWVPAVAVVDASSGRLLRLTRYRDGKIATRLELRSVSDGGPDDFGFTPPDGLPVVEEPERDGSGGSDDDGDMKFFEPDGRPASPPEEVRAVADALKKQMDETVAAARGFLGSLFGDRS